MMIRITFFSNMFLSLCVSKSSVLKPTSYSASANISPIKAVNAVKSAKNKTKLLCGAGIVSGEDVSKASELGAQGILVASGIIKAKSWNNIISEFSKAFS